VVGTQEGVAIVADSGPEAPRLDRGEATIAAASAGVGGRGTVTP
jgi:hypothetical protein